MALRRGFKSEAERIAKNVRADLGLRPADPITLDAVAELLGVEVRAGDELIPRDRFIALKGLQQDAFFACTLRPSPDRVVVVFNPLSAPTRRISDLAHEFAHLLLDHDLSRVETLGDATFLTCDPVQEEEAAWLSGCLVLPRPLLLAEAAAGAGVGDIAMRYGVSEAMASYRLKVTGVARQAQQPAARRTA